MQHLLRGLDQILWCVIFIPAELHKLALTAVQYVRDEAIAAIHN